MSLIAKLLIKLAIRTMVNTIQITTKTNRNSSAPILFVWIIRTNCKWVMQQNKCVGGQRGK